MPSGEKQEDLALGSDLFPILVQDIGIVALLAIFIHLFWFDINDL